MSKIVSAQRCTNCADACLPNALGYVMGLDRFPRNGTRVDPRRGIERSIENLCRRIVLVREARPPMKVTSARLDKASEAFRSAKRIATFKHLHDRTGP